MTDRADDGWNASVVYEDGEEADVGSDGTMADRRRREAARLIREEGPLTRAGLQLRMRSDAHKLLTEVGELVDRGDVEEGRDPNDRRVVVYSWAGDGDSNA